MCDDWQDSDPIDTPLVCLVCRSCNGELILQCLLKCGEPMRMFSGFCNGDASEQ